MLVLLLSAVLAADPPAKVKPVRALVLNFDPWIEQAGAKKRLHEAGGWNDPRKLSEGYIADLKAATKGRVVVRIAEWRDLDAFPVKRDRFRYTADEYMACRKRNGGWHDPDGLDYPKTLAEHRVVEFLDAGKADEVWIFGAPYFGFWEACMAGPRAFFINGEPYPDVQAKKPFVIMGFNYERGVAEMLHSLCHRVESTMSRASGGWRSEQLDTPWARFAANAHQSGGVAGVGTCHYPPNGVKDYDYGNPRVVQSDADDWLRYPKLTGKRKPVSCETWGGPDYHRNYFKWWYARFPRAMGVDAEGRPHDWWRYVLDFDDFAEGGRPRPK